MESFHSPATANRTTPQKSKCDYRVNRMSPRALSPRARSGGGRVGGGPPDLEGQGFEVLSPHLCPTTSRPWDNQSSDAAQQCRRWHAGAGLRVRSLPSGLWLLRVPVTSRPHDATLSCATRRPGWRSHTAGMCRVLSPTSVVGAIEAKNLHRAIGNPISLRTAP